MKLKLKLQLKLKLLKLKLLKLKLLKLKLLLMLLDEPRPCSPNEKSHEAMVDFVGDWSFHANVEN